MSAMPEVPQAKRPSSPTTSSSAQLSKRVRGNAELYRESKSIKVLIGPDKREFSIHEDLLRAESGVFEYTYKNQGQKDCRNFDGSTLTLEDQHVGGFGIIFDYIYTPNFSVTTPVEDPKDLDDYIHAWMYADKLRMEDCKNSIMDQIQLIIRGGPWTSKAIVRKAVKLLQKDLDPDRSAPPYRFLVNRLAHDLGDGAFHSDHPLRNRDGQLWAMIKDGGMIMADVLTKYFKEKNTFHRDPLDPAILNDCKYHEHQDQAAAQACLRAPKPTVPSTVTDSRPSNNSTAGTSSGIFGTSTSETGVSGKSLFGGSPTTRVSQISTNVQSANGGFSFFGNSAPAPTAHNASHTVNSRPISPLNPNMIPLGGKPRPK